MPNIYDFIKDPWTSIKEGYQPSYMDCVSACAGAFMIFVKALIECFNPKGVHILDLTIREEAAWLLKVLTLAIFIITYPISYWFLAYMQYKNIWWNINAWKNEEDEV